VNTPEESAKMQELFFKYDIPWGSGHMRPLYLNLGFFPDYLTVTLGRYFGSPQISHGTKPTRDEWNDVEVDWTVYTVNDYDTVENILKYGKKMIVPSYKPRRIDRMLESFDKNSYPYGSIAFWVSGLQDIERIVNLFHKEWKVENYNKPEMIVRELNTALEDKYTEKCVVVAFMSDEFYISKPSNFMMGDKYKDSTDPNIYTIRDLGRFGLKPSYLPRKTNREVI
jgi:hypothetical protein